MTTVRARGRYGRVIRTQRRSGALVYLVEFTDGRREWLPPWLVDPA